MAPTITKGGCLNACKAGEPTTKLESQLLRAAEKEEELAAEARLATLEHVGAEKFNRIMHHEMEPEDWRHTDRRDNITAAELQLAKRCHGAHIECLAQDITPVASHYQLNHYDVPFLDPEAHRVSVRGLVDQELNLSLKDVRARPSVTEAVLLACAGTGRMSIKNRFWTHVPWGVDSFGCAKWTGCSLADILKEAGVQPTGKQVIFTGADRGVEGGKVQYFQRSLSIEDAMNGHVMLAYQMNGVDLTPAHGAPMRLIVAGWYGMASVKWLTSIEIVEGGWWGHQMEAYSFRQAEEDPGRVPLTRLPVRALMAPPGFPDFFSRTRLVAPGPHKIRGKAWAGAAALERVEFSYDGGASWIEAELLEKNGPFGWAPWEVTWTAQEPGVYILACRAFDKKGRSQDLASDDTFNWTGMGDTQPQMVYVKVDPKIEEIGAHIDLTSEQRAAKPSLNVAYGQAAPLGEQAVDALYRSPGSQ